MFWPQASSNMLDWWVTWAVPQHCCGFCSHTQHLMLQGLSLFPTPLLLYLKMHGYGHKSVLLWVTPSPLLVPNAQRLHLKCDRTLWDWHQSGRAAAPSWMWIHLWYCHTSASWVYPDTPDSQAVLLLGLWGVSDVPHSNQRANGADTTLNLSLKDALLPPSLGACNNDFLVWDCVPFQACCTVSEASIYQQPLSNSVKIAERTTTTSHRGTERTCHTTIQTNKLNKMNFEII